MLEQLEVRKKHGRTFRNILKKSHVPTSFLSEKICSARLAKGTDMIDHIYIFFKTSAEL